MTSIYRRVIDYYLPSWWPTTVAMGLNLLQTPLHIVKIAAPAYLLGNVLPALGKPQHGLTLQFRDSLHVSLEPFSLSQIVAGCSIAFVAAHLLSAWLNVTSQMMFFKVGLKGLLALRTDLYGYLHSLPLKFHDSRRSADSTSRVAYDSQSLQTFYSKFIFLLQSAQNFFTYILTMWALDIGLTILALAVIPLMAITFRAFADRIRNQATRISERESAVLSLAQEGLSSVKMVQAFGREQHEIQQFATSARQSLEANVRMQSICMTSSLISATLLVATTAAVCWMGGEHVLSGQISLSSLLVIKGCMDMLYQPIESITSVGWDLERAAGAARRCFEVLDQKDEVPEKPNAQRITHTRGDLRFENVSFGYTPDRNIISNVNLHLVPGQTVAFVGTTGAGKSTLLSLVPRFYDPSGGRVLLDGIDLRDLEKKSLRQQISIVLQDTLLFSSTIRENIAYGRPDATDAEIIEAAKRAQAHDFITALPQGYDSEVGERGGHLSVGQRQRIGIARAFLKNAPILLLDEPTSALDPTTESAIMNTIEELMQGRTTLIITHRIATIHNVDKIVVLGPGGVVEEGRGPELVAKGGFYANLYLSANLGEASGNV
ncbi:MAG: ABC-type multidrug transport system, ATPase and permease component [Verrucomicrobiota bacterium]|jgi:ATP-binding cassette subfamily B protein/subfamily B ATP-binding cassette protein MsbA